MRLTKTLISTFLVVLVVVMVPPVSSSAQTIAAYDFDGLFMNVIKTWGGPFDDEDGGPGNFFGVGSINNWPQDAGVPFSIIDESGSTFPSDAEGIVSAVNSNPDNVFVVISDTAEINSTNPNFTYIACWQFNVSSATGPLAFSIEMGQCSDGSSNDGFSDGFVLFEYRVNGGPWLTAFSCLPFDSTDSGFSYRNMDSGFAPVEAFVCQATGPAEITKISAEDGLPSSNTILDKCPPTGSPGAGTLDTFMTEIVGGSGASTVALRVSSVLPDEGFVFDNIKIVQVPEEVVVVSPTKVTPTQGEFNSGDVMALAESDNVDYTMRRRGTDVQSRTEFELKSISPTATPNVFEFKLEGAVFARRNVVQTIELFDYVAGSWELVSTADAARTPSPDSTVTATPTGDLSRFVDAKTMCIEARVHFQSDIPRQRFSSNTDQAVWMIQ